MIEEIKFSGHGDRPTAFERRLLAQCPGQSMLAPLASRLVQLLGNDKGAEVFCLMLDELGAGRPTIPQRRAFFRELWREERDALIVSLGSRHDWTRTDIAEHLGVSVQWVRRVLKRQTVSRVA